MLTNRYMTSVKNLPSIMSKIIEGTAPEKFTVTHLKGIGFKSSNDQGVIPLLKDLGFLSADGAPTQRYLGYRDRSSARTILAEGIREAYSDLFHINEKPSENDRNAIEGKFKAVHNTTDRIAKEQTKTFFALLELADLNASAPIHSSQKTKEKKEVEITKEHTTFPPVINQSTMFSGLRYNIEIHLPATKDPEVYNAIFKSLKEHLLEN